MSDDTTAGPADEPSSEPVTEPAKAAAKKAAAKRAPAERAVPPAAAVSSEPVAEPDASVEPAEVTPPVEQPAAIDDTHDDAGDDGRDEQDARDRSSKSDGLPLWQESLILVGVALVLAIVIKAFFVQAFYIPSDSMEPGLVDNDRILVEKPSYWGGGTPQRGDVVVFKDPGGWLNAGEDDPGNFIARGLAKVGLYPAGGHLVKRVIGVAGDTIVCCDTDGNISVNGYALDEHKYLLDDKTKDCNGPMTGDCDWTAGPVPKGTIFVMGDNRNNSGDSTTHLCTPEETECTQDPFVKVSLVTGKVLGLIWPLGHVGFLHRPSVFGKIPDAK